MSDLSLCPPVGTTLGDAISASGSSDNVDQGVVEVGLLGAGMFPSGRRRRAGVFLGSSHVPATMGSNVRGQPRHSASSPG
jgi:hypothetical protein